MGEKWTQYLCKDAIIPSEKMYSRDIHRTVIK